MSCRAWATRIEVMRLLFPFTERARKAAGGQARARSRRRSARGPRARSACKRVARQASKSPQGLSLVRARPCAARPPRAAPPLGLAWPARRCASRLCSDLDMLAVAPPPGAASRCPLARLRCSAPSMRAQACPPAALRRDRGVRFVAHLGASAKPWVGVRRQRHMRRRGTQGSRPRAQRATCSDSSRLFERSERSERSEFRDGP